MENLIFCAVIIVEIKRNIKIGLQYERLLFYPFLNTRKYETNKILYQDNFLYTLEIGVVFNLIRP